MFHGGVVVPEGWEFQGGWVCQGDGSSRGMSVLGGGGCLGGWEFLMSVFLMAKIDIPLT